MTQDDNVWTTRLSNYADGKVSLHGYDLAEVAQTLDFGASVFLSFTGNIPTPAQARMVNAMLSISIIQGIAGSGAVTRVLTGTGAQLQVAVAGGLLSITDKVGGATEKLGATLEELLGPNSDSGATIADAQVDQIAHQCLDQIAGPDGRVDGFGHPNHPTGDPRAKMLLDLAASVAVKGRHCAVLERMGILLSERKKRSLKPNIDGATVAILLDMGISWRFATAMILVGRSAGLCAQAVEQRVAPSDFRKVAVRSRYIGPQARKLG